MESNTSVSSGRVGKRISGDWLVLLLRDVVVVVVVVEEEEGWW